MKKRLKFDARVANRELKMKFRASDEILMSLVLRPT